MQTGTVGRRMWAELGTYRRRPLLLLGAGALVLVLAAACSRWSPQLPDFLSGLLYGIGISLCLAGLLVARLPDPRDTATPAVRRRYLREFTPAMAAYVASLWLSIVLLRHVEAPALRALVALMPVPAIAFAMRAMLRHIRDTDELQRRIEVESISIATALVSLGYLAGGFLQSAKVIDIPSDVSMIWVFPLICLTYGIAKCVISRRYG